MIRIDLYLVQNNFYTSRQKAVDALKASLVLVNDKIISKPSYLVSNQDKIKVISATEEYVSRGGFKLKHALEVFNIDLNDQVVLDIGSSTGGFTDCCLQSNARLVYALDVGDSQLAASIKSDIRVVIKDNTNARYINRSDFDPLPDFICVDVSFISITYLIPIISSLLDSNKQAVILVKPQFEVGKKFLNKGGVVKDKRQQEKVFNQIKTLLYEAKLIQSSWIESPIKGREGNTEYLVYLIKE